MRISVSSARGYWPVPSASHLVLRQVSEYTNVRTQSIGKNEDGKASEQRRPLAKMSFKNAQSKTVD